MSEPDFPSGDTALHTWFELSYAQYLTIPRSILQSMPRGWQEQFATLLCKLDDTFDWRPRNARYWVSLRSQSGRYVSISRDPFMDYERGRKQWTQEEIESLGDRP